MRSMKQRLGGREIPKPVPRDDGYLNTREAIAATIYKVKAQSPREMTPEWWESIKKNFPGSARECLRLADAEIADMMSEGER